MKTTINIIIIIVLMIFGAYISNLNDTASAEKAVYKLQKKQIEEQTEILQLNKKLYEEQKKNAELSNLFYEELNRIVQEKKEELK